MLKIKIMDELLANKIAAGEVVERCASVVKELVENSIDAGSNQIKVELVEAGTTEMKITDNGSGMEKEDAVLSFSRHATSKLQSEEDLYRIKTLGFRGEALASIASVSRITMQTSTGDIGTLIQIEGGRTILIEQSEARRGTMISVRDLFYNTPARLKHMKSLYTELASITDYLNKLALSHPDIAFTLTNNGNVLLKTDGTGNLLKTIHSIYGIEVVKKMIEINGEDADYEVSGFVTIPEVHRSNRNAMITLVNGRVVRNSELNRVINDAYHGYKPDNRYPVVVLNIIVDSSLVDVNIHPTKMDIKFSKFEELCLLIESIIKKSLKSYNWVSRVEVPKESVQKREYVVEQIPISSTFEDVVPYQKEERLFEPISIHVPEVERIVEPDIIDPLDSISEEVSAIKTSNMPIIYPVGLVHGTYIVGQNDTGMYLIDQHAAEERINYERVKEKLGNPRKETISLLVPITIELSNSDYIVLKENFSLLSDMNFEIEEFGMNSIIVKSHPVWIPKEKEEQAIKNMIDLIVQKEKGFTIEKFNEKIAIMISCKMSIKANDHISVKEMEALLTRLRMCENPFHCPHGRPIIVHYSNYELEKLFKRSGF